MSFFNLIGIFESNKLWCKTVICGVRFYC